MSVHQIYTKQVISRLFKLDILLNNRLKRYCIQKKTFMRISSLSTFLKRDPVFVVATVLAFVSILLVPIQRAYLEYFDWKTIACLFCLMVVVAACSKMNLFVRVSAFILKFANTPRQLSSALVFLTFFFSMLITNDVALLTFVPLTIVLFTVSNTHKNILFTVVLQTVAANVGSSLTVVGNPQNLFLYNYYDLNAFGLTMTMLPYVLLGALSLLLLLLFVSNDHISPVLNKQDIIPLQKRLLIRYGLLFLISLAAVFDFIPYPVALLVVLLFAEKSLLPNVDYTLLLTFLMLFIFVGNLGQLSWVRGLLGALQGHEFLVALSLSQCISNVPAALFLSHFTNLSEPLLIGVNVGGCGTLIASMASVISFKLFIQYDARQSARYFLCFSVISFSLLLLYVFEYWLLCKV